MRNRVGVVGMAAVSSVPRVAEVDCTVEIEGAGIDDYI